MLETIKGRALLATLLILLGFSFSMVYVFASGSQEYAVVLDEQGNTLGFFTVKLIWVGEEPKLTVGERVKLEEQAIDVALSDLRVKELVEGKQYSVVSVYYTRVQCEVVSQNGNRLTLRTMWDGKQRATVTIIFADGSGYYMEVNLTDGTIEDIRYTPKVFP